MKKFLSYLFTFITMFAISATVTIKLKSDILESNNANSSASASSQQTLLGGIMSSLEENPKLDIDGNLGVVYNGENIGIELNVQADLTELTNPQIKGNVVVNHNGNDLDILFTYAQNEIFLSYNNMNISAKIEDITDLVNLVKTIMPTEETNEQPVETYNQTVNEETNGLSFDLDSLMAALENPTKQAVGDDTLYTITLPGICTANLLCDNEFNIKNLSISEFIMLEGLDVSADLNVVSDENLQIVKPEADDKYLNVEQVNSIIDNLLNLDYVEVSAWTAIYKDTKLFEHIKTSAKLNIEESVYDIRNVLSGVLDGNLAIGYANSTVYANFQDIYVKANTGCFDKLMDILPEDSTVATESSDTINSVLTWFKENYQSILNNAVISSNQIKLVADLTGIFGQNGEVSLVIDINDNKISALRLNGINYNEYGLSTSIYISEPNETEITFNEEVYFDAEQIFEIVDWVQNIDKLAVNTNLNLITGEVNEEIKLNAIADVKNNAYKINLPMHNNNLQAIYLNDIAYLSFNNIKLSAGKDFITQLVNDFMPKDLDTSKINQVAEVAKELDINEILNLLNLSLNNNGLHVDADLSMFVGTNLKIKANVNFNNGIYLNIEDSTIGSISLSGNIDILNSDQTVEITEEYTNLDCTYNTIQKVVETLKYKTFSGVANINVSDFELEVDYNLNIGETVNGTLSTNIYGVDVKLDIIDNELYLAAKDVYIKATVDEILDIVKELVGKEINISSGLKNLDIKETLSNISEQNLFTRLEELDNVLYLELFNGLKLSLGGEETLNNIAVEYNDIKVELTLNTSNDEIIHDIDTSKYLQLADVYETVTNVYNYVMSSQYYVGVDANIYGYQITGYIGYDQDGLVAKLNTEIQDIAIQLVLLNGVVYVSAENINVKLTIKDLPDLLETICTTFEIELPDSVKELVENIANNASIEDTLDSVQNITGETKFDLQEVLTELEIALTTDKLIVGIMGADIAIDISNKTLNSASVEYTIEEEIISANIDIVEKQNIQIAQVDYIDIAELADIVVNAYNYILDNQYYINLNVSAYDYNVTGYIGYDQDGLAAKLYTEIEGFAVELVMLNKVVYAKVENIFVKVALEDISSLLESICSTFEIELPEGVQELVENIVNGSNLETLLENIETITGETEKEELDIKEIISGLTISLTSDLLNVSVMGANIAVGLKDNNITSISVDYKLEEDTIDAELVITDKQTIEPVAGNYIDLADVEPLLADIKSFIDATNYTGSFNLVYEDIEVSGNVMLVITDGVISAQITANFRGLDLVITYLNDTIYAYVDGIYVKIATGEIADLIEWINSTFNTEISLETNEFSLEDLDLSKLLLTLSDNVVGVSYDKLSASIIVNEQMSADISYDKLFVNLQLTTANNTISVDDSLYRAYTDITEIVDSVKELIDGQKIKLTANAEVYRGTDKRFDATAKFEIDLNTFELYGNVSLTGEQEFEFMIAYSGDYWYVDYNNLKLKINKTDLAEIMAILLEFAGIDPSVLPFLENVANGLDVNVDNLETLTPNLDTSDPLSMIEMIKGLNLVNGDLTILLDGNKITDNPNADTMTVCLKTDDGELTGLVIDDLYTGVTSNEYFNLDISVQDWTGVTPPPSGNYIDLSGANELIKAVINTAELNYFEIDGSVNVIGNLIGINIDWNIPLNIKVKLDENRKPEIMATLGEIPAVVGINNDVPYKFGDTESGSNRMLYIYYKDEYVYFHRTEYVDIMFGAGKRRYEKKLKAHYTSVFDDPLYYLQYGVGFSDSIMDSIEESLAKSEGHTPNLGNIINSFVVNNDKNFSLELNMYEITNDPMIESMTIGIGVINNNETNNKNYVGNASFNMFMPIASGVFELTLDSDNLKLINIGKELDFTKLYDYINNYKWAADKEYEATWNKSEDGEDHSDDWTLAAERKYTIDFIENGGSEVTNITGSAGSSITLPTYSNRLVVDQSANTRTTYRFDGWWTNENFKSGTQFTDNVMPKKDTTLYAKWTVINVEYVVTITFNSNGGSAIESVSGITGTWVDISYKVPTKADTWVDKGYIWYKGQWEYVFTSYTFAGWYTDSSCTTKFNGYLPNSNITLYAKWTTSTRTEYLYSWDRP